MANLKNITSLTPMERIGEMTRDSFSTAIRNSTSSVAQSTSSSMISTGMSTVSTELLAASQAYNLEYGTNEVYATFSPAVSRTNGEELSSLRRSMIGDTDTFIREVNAFEKIARKRRERQPTVFNVE